VRISPNSTKSTSNHVNQQVSVAYPITLLLFFFVEFFDFLYEFYILEFLFA